jgi:hypothetical protein
MPPRQGMGAVLAPCKTYMVYGELSSLNYVSSTVVASFGWGGRLFTEQPQTETNRLALGARASTDDQHHDARYRQF